MNRALPFAVILLPLLVPTLRAADFTSLKDGDRIIFYGDSITQQRLYTTYLEQYIRCRYPDLHLTFFNAGWGGDSAPGALARADRDVLILKPTVVTLFFGMNDGHYAPPDAATRATYHDAMDKLVAKLQAAGARVIVFSPGCVDEDKNAHLKDVKYNQTLAGLRDAAKEVADAHNCQFVDIYTPMLQFQTEQKKKNTDFTISIDGVHPTEAGHLVMTRYMLPALAEPATAVATDKPAAPTSADAPYTITTRAMPFWMPQDAQLIAEKCGLFEYVAGKVTIPELPQGNYLVVIDDGAAANVTALQLATGIPLAASDSIRAHKLHDLIIAKNENYFAAWRNVRIPFGDIEGVDAVYDDMFKADTAFNIALENFTQKSESTITLFAEPPGPNLALNKPYTCTDPNPFGWNPGLTDGFWGTAPPHCFATNATDQFPKSVTIDLGASSPIGSVVVGVPPFGSTKTIQVSVSPDNKTFTEIGSHTYALRRLQHHIYNAPASTTGRYVRLTYVDHYTDSADYPPTFAFTTEAEVYAQPAPK